MLSYLFFTILIIIPLWKIHEKAGQNPAISIICIVPIIGILISMAVLAFGQWKTVTNTLAEA